MSVHVILWTKPVILEPNSANDRTNQNASSYLRYFITVQSSVNKYVSVGLYACTSTILDEDHLVKNWVMSPIITSVAHQSMTHPQFLADLNQILEIYIFMGLQCKLQNLIFNKFLFLGSVKKSYNNIYEEYRNFGALQQEKKSMKAVFYKLNRRWSYYCQQWLKSWMTKLS